MDNHFLVVEYKNLIIPLNLRLFLLKSYLLKVVKVHSWSHTEQQHLKIDNQSKYQAGKWN